MENSFSSKGGVRNGFTFNCPNAGLRALAGLIVPCLFAWDASVCLFRGVALTRYLYWLSLPYVS